MDTLKTFRCVCCSRPGYTRELESVLARKYKRLVYIVDDDALLSTALDSVSSTKVRRRLIEGKATAAIVSEAVDAYLREEKIGGKVAGRAQWLSSDKEAVPYKALPAPQSGGKNRMANLRASDEQTQTRK